MPDYQYTGQEAFGNDPGTFWLASEANSGSMLLTGSDVTTVKKEMKHVRSSKPIVWFVDDERASREWFRDYHGLHFGVVTFSGRKYFLTALNRGFVCDAIVTDIFFPAKTVDSDKYAEQLLSIYKKIENKRVGDLKLLWKAERKLWALDGFSVARDAIQRERPIPVFLFSRKAALLLNIKDYLGEPPAVANSYWILEKIEPSADVETSKIAARIQRDRIFAVLGTLKTRWRTFLRSLRIGVPGVSMNLEKLV